ncbi:hypothetical protein ACFL1H_01445 [Nanoarchaeota archaeon]
MLEEKVFNGGIEKQSFSDLLGKLGGYKMDYVTLEKDDQGSIVFNIKFEKENDLEKELYLKDIPEEDRQKLVKENKDLFDRVQQRFLANYNLDQLNTNKDVSKVLDAIDYAMEIYDNSWDNNDLFILYGEYRDQIKSEFKEATILGMKTFPALTMIPRLLKDKLSKLEIDLDSNAHYPKILDYSYEVADKLAEDLQGGINVKILLRTMIDLMYEDQLTQESKWN